MVLTYDVIVRKHKFSDVTARQFVPGLLAVWLLLVNIGSQSTETGGIRDHMQLGKAKILAIDSVILSNYVEKLLVPRDLSVLYDVPTDGISTAIVLSLIGWAAAAGLLIYYRQRFPMAIWAGLCWLALLAPVLNLVPMTTLMQDR